LGGNTILANHLTRGRKDEAMHQQRSTAILYTSIIKNADHKSAPPTTLLRLA
jgi:hypothetical protein